ncbi:hypothetical protein K439DRAFT_1621586 [Ramaria rubella]|nr:hypothetical protein K439DRAFT_1625135 [Ramaria rubella]KAF8578132.1 hypothetical protein K439DRAFT_1621586 [Ramaria rubella]
MKFGIAPSRSPSPSRKCQRRGRSTFGLGPYDSSDEEIDHDLSEYPSSESDSLFYDSESEVPLRSSLNRSVQEQRNINEIVLSFRRRGEYEDPFKQWAKETRTAAFRTATKRYEANPASTTATRQREIELHKKRVKESYNLQFEEVTAILEQMNIRSKQEEAKLLSDYKERERLLWQRVEGVIKDEDDKVRRKLEAEEKARREEQERARREEERRKAEEEKKKKEEKEKALREELLRKKEEKEAEDAKKQAEEEAQKRADMAKLDKGRKEAGFTTAREDWETARQGLKLVKEGYIPTIKRDANLRSAWSKGRRAMVPKIGQLTNTQSEISRITNAIIQIIRIQPPHPEPLYFSLLSALAKAILMQAETEVSARAVTAIPLAKVTIGLLTQLEYFPDVLFARIVQRTGGWVIPIPVPKPENMSEVDYKKLRGYRTEREEQKDFETRISGVMTLYFAILTQDVSESMPPLWALPRYWTYIARLTSTPVLLRSDMAMQILASALEVGGARAKRVWGNQFIKVLGLLYKGIQNTSDALTESREVELKQVGASGPEGRAGRVKLLLEIENVMSS